MQPLQQNVVLKKPERGNREKMKFALWIQMLAWVWKYLIERSEMKRQALSNRASASCSWQNSEKLQSRIVARSLQPRARNIIPSLFSEYIQKALVAPTFASIQLLIYSKQRGFLLWISFTAASIQRRRGFSKNFLRSLCLLTHIA
jgi:hypothetical protein